MRKVKVKVVVIKNGVEVGRLAQNKLCNFDYLYKIQFS